MCRCIGFTVAGIIRSEGICLFGTVIIGNWFDRRNTNLVWYANNIFPLVKFVYRNRTDIGLFHFPYKRNEQARNQTGSVFVPDKFSWIRHIGLCQFLSYSFNGNYIGTGAGVWIFNLSVPFPPVKLSLYQNLVFEV